MKLSELVPIVETKRESTSLTIRYPPRDYSLGMREKVEGMEILVADDDGMVQRMIINPDGHLGAVYD